MPLPGHNPVFFPRGNHSPDIHNTVLTFLYYFASYVCVPKQYSFNVAVFKFIWLGRTVCVSSLTQPSFLWNSSMLMCVVFHSFSLLYSIPLCHIAQFIYPFCTWDVWGCCEQYCLSILLYVSLYTCTWASLGCEGRSEISRWKKKRKLLGNRRYIYIYVFNLTRWYNLFFKTRIPDFHSYQHLWDFSVALHPWVYLICRTSKLLRIWWVCSNVCLLF